MALVFFLEFVAGGLLAIVGILGLLGKLPPNALVGIRTNYTMENDQRWYDTHRGGAPALIFGGIAIAAANLAFLPFALMGKISDTLAIVVVLVSVVVLLVVVIQSAVVGVRYAKAREQAQQG